MIVLTIAQNELKRLFFSPLAWLILAVVQLLLAIFFYVLLSQFMEPSGWSSGRGLSEFVIAGTLQIAGIILLLVSPLLTMRLFSDELRTGTIKLLLSAPVSVTELVLGKFIGMSGFHLCMLLLISLMPLSLLFGAPIDLWQLAAGLLGLALLLLAFTAIGLFVSTLTQQPAVAATGSFAVLFVMWIIHIAANTDNQYIAAIFNYLSLLRHYNNFIDGVFNSTDFIYYLLISTTFIVLGIWRLDAIRSNP